MMKFKQKLEQTKQLILVGWQYLVLKPLAFITNLIAPSQENIKSETTGQKPTRHCIACGVELKEYVNWWKSFVEKGHYKCIDCYNIRREENRLKQKARESQK